MAGRPGKAECHWEGGAGIFLTVAARPGLLDEAIEATRPILDSVRIVGP